MVVVEAGLVRDSGRLARRLHGGMSRVFLAGIPARTSQPVWPEPLLC